MKLYHLAEAAALLLLSHGSLAALPSNTTSWQQYVYAPSERHLTPVAVLSTTGNVTNAEALVSGSGIAYFSRAPQQTSFPSWPAGTTAQGSSEAGSNTVNGAVRTYYASNAIDGNLTTFWNDATPGVYPDTLTITSPSAVTLEGVTVESVSDGVPVDYTIETWDGSNWNTAGSVTGNSALRSRVAFDSQISTTQVRLTVTKDQSVSAGEYSRVAELWPGLVADDAVAEAVLDFGQNVVGFLSIEFVGASTNAPGIELAFSESLEYLTDRSDFTRSDNGNQITQGTDHIAVPAAPTNWTDSLGCTYNGAQVCSDGLHGFRYLKISIDTLPTDDIFSTPAGWVDIASVSLNFTAYLGTPDSYSGWFESSDAALNEYWYAATYTNEMTIDTFLLNTVDVRNTGNQTLVGQTVLFDGAKRDRDPYVGDIAVSGKTSYLSHQDTAGAVYNVLADLGNHQSSNGWIPPASLYNYGVQLFDYSFWWVVSFWDYILYTGNVDQVQPYYSNLQDLLDNWVPTVTDTATGLLTKSSTQGWGDYGFLSRYGIVTYYNALYVLALQNAAKIANVLNETSDAEKWLQQADIVSQAINDNLWDASVGAYVDEQGGTRHAQDGNAIAVIAGIANSSQAASALGYLADNTAKYWGNAFMDDDSLGSGTSDRVYAFISYFDLDARFLIGDADSALDEIHRLYGTMIQSDPGITFWEGVGTNGSAYEGAFTSLCHGWSTGVVPVLTNYVLGLKPTGPGYETFSIQPAFPTNLTWARGQEATPYGDIYLEWTADDDNTRTITFSSPAGTLASVTVPMVNSVSLDGVVLWSASGQITEGVEGVEGVAVEGNSVTIIDIPSGNHTVVSQ
jgi:hypothetical protein